MKVSIIIPVHNSDKFLKKCLQSIFDQTYKNIEVICIDDCSTDNSLQILNDFKMKYSTQLIVSKNPVNLGAGRSRDKGITLASGEYIMFIDSDDYIAPDYIETYVKNAYSSDIDIIVGGYIRDNSKALVFHYVSNSVWSITTYTIPVAKLFRKKFIVDNNIQFKNFYCGEDIYFSLSILCCYPKYKVIHYAGYYYFKNINSTTQTMSPDKKQEKYVSQIFDNIIEDNKGKQISKNVQNVIEYTYFANMVNALITYGHGCGIASMRDKCNYFDKDLTLKFPNYKRNPLFKLKKPQGQSNKIHLGVMSVYYLKKIHAEKLLFYIIALI